MYAECTVSPLDRAFRILCTLEPTAWKARPAAAAEKLPVRTRHVAETLATGEATGCVARMFGCSASRVSQLRRELYDAWLVFTGEAPTATSSVLA